MELFSQELKELNVKIQDFNIYELFKSNSVDGGSSDAGVILVQNLEKKVFKKFEFIDEKGKRSDEEIYKLKGEISNMKINAENLTKNLSILKDEQESTNSDAKLRLENLANNLKELSERLEYVNSDLLDKINSYEINMKNNLNSLALNQSSNIAEDKLKHASNSLHEEDMKLIKDNMRRTIELEKNFKVFVNNANFESLRHDINKVNELLGLKLNSSEIGDIRENMSKSIFYF